MASPGGGRVAGRGGRGGELRHGAGQAGSQGGQQGGARTECTAGRAVGVHQV